MGSVLKTFCASLAASSYLCASIAALADFRAALEEDISTLHATDDARGSPDKFRAAEAISIHACQSERKREAGVENVVDIGGFGEIFTEVSVDVMRKG